MRKGIWILATLAVFALVLPLIPVAQAPAPAVKKVSATGFMVENSGIRVVVETETARYKGKSAYIPMVVFVGFSGAKAITLTRGAFTLTDPGGKVAPMADLATIKDKKNYGDFAVADDYTFIHKTVEAGPCAAAFNGLGFQKGTCFFPNVGGVPALIRDTVEVRPTAWTWALMYFANPGGKMKGTYKLTYTDPATKGAVTVPFEIEWK